jgi:hypothetical protein
MRQTATGVFSLLSRELRGRLSAPIIEPLHPFPPLPRDPPVRYRSRGIRPGSVSVCRHSPPCARGVGGSRGAGIPACRVGIRADIHRSPGSGHSQRPPYARRNAGAAA